MEPVPSARSESAHRVTLVPGDGTGPELVQAALLVLEATGVPLAYERRLAGVAAWLEKGVFLPSDTLDSMRSTGVTLKGPLTNARPSDLPPRSPRGPDLAAGHHTAMIAMRHHLDAVVNIRHAVLFRGANPRYADVPIDIWVVRETTEDLYNNPETRLGPDAAAVLKTITRQASARIARAAFEHARRYRRRRVTVVHRGDVLRLTDGLFGEAARATAAEYPDIESDEVAPDAAAMHLVRHPERFDVLLTQFVQGDMLMDLCAGLVGGLGMMGGMNLGPSAAIFEAAHGSAPKYAGLDRVNPCALVLSAAMLLDYLGEVEAAAAVRRAIAAVVASGQTVTYDLGGGAGTWAMAEAIAGEVVRVPRADPRDAFSWGPTAPAG